jgi:Tfp pilus assembly protein PilO
MVAKLVFGLLVVALVLSVAVIAAYRYFDNRAERSHEKRMMREEHRHEQMSDVATEPIDRKLEKADA